MGDKTDIQFSLDDKCSTKNILFINYIPLFLKKNAEKIFLFITSNIIYKNFNNNIIYGKCQKKENNLIFYQKKASFTIQSSSSKTKHSLDIFNRRYNYK